ncbi:amidase [Aquirhabdus parva]|uniref:Amidase n=1 Tax=Aquirhabdus parva TaxID=2283318 RepID=A0A345P3Q9_9GAMM|nr:amidase [Aquirhabdus parva]AXI01918.1 amidase [Aquirhabdus parva]
MSAFMPGPLIEVRATTSGPLSDLRFAVKDLIDIQGVTTGGGNPTWLSTHDAAKEHAPCVQALLDAGASVYGKTITDELAYSLEGENVHYGTPFNPQWPWALPGGSSSGSASAVASGEVDFALGTDTGGSVRVPAAFCGIWGFRPTHNAVSLAGVLPFAPCFDTVGWFASSGDVLARVADVLLPEAIHAPSTLPLRLLEEAFAIRARHEPDDAYRLQQIANTLGVIESISVFDDQSEAWLRCYQHLQDHDIQTTLGDWIRESKPLFGAAIAERFARIESVDSAQLADSRIRKESLCQYIQQIVDTSYLVFPTTPYALLPKDANADLLSDFYYHALTINALAAIGGLPQITIPIQSDAQRPLALSILGARGSDRQLIALARELFRSHQGLNSVSL